MYEPREGDHVRLVFEAVLKDGYYEWTKGQPASWLASVADRHAVSIEKIAPPLPPLPTTTGSVMRCNLVGTQNEWAYRFLTESGWIADDGGDIDSNVKARIVPYEIIFDAGDPKGSSK